MKTKNTFKTMIQLDNQSFTLSERNWRRKNIWESLEASKAAKNRRDALICKATLSSAVYYLAKKAKTINENLNVIAFQNDYTVGLEYNSPEFGICIRIGSMFDIEELLNNPDKILENFNK